MRVAPREHKLLSNTYLHTCSRLRIVCMYTRITHHSRGRAPPRTLRMLYCCESSLTRARACSTLIQTQTHKPTDYTCAVSAALVPLWGLGLGYATRARARALLLYTRNVCVAYARTHSGHTSARIAHAHTPPHHYYVRVCVCAMARASRSARARSRPASSLGGSRIFTEANARKHTQACVCMLVVSVRQLSSTACGAPSCSVARFFGLSVCFSVERFSPV